MDSKMQKVANIIGYLIGGILVSLVGVAIIAVLVKAILWLWGCKKMAGFTQFTIPDTIWVGKYEYMLIKASIDGKQFDINYRKKYPLVSYENEFEINISFETLLSPNDREVEKEFTKRLELLGGTIEDPND